MTAEEEIKTPLERLIFQLDGYKNMFKADGNRNDRNIRGTYVNAIMLAKQLLYDEQKYKKSYASQVVKQALKDAADRAKILYDDGVYDEEQRDIIYTVLGVDKKSILETPYNLDCYDNI